MPHRFSLLWYCRRNKECTAEKSAEYDRSARALHHQLLSEEDYSGIMETLYLVSAPGMREKIMDGIATPLADCVDEAAVEW